MRNDITIRPEEHKDYKDIIVLILRSFKEGTDYSDGTDIIALVEEIRDSEYYIPELSFVAELDGKLVGHFLFSRFLYPFDTKAQHSASHTLAKIIRMHRHRCQHYNFRILCSAMSTFFYR